MTEPTTVRELRRLLKYDPVTGIFVWRVSRGRARIGQAAGTKKADGYTVIRIKGRPYRAARLAWLYMTGGWPHALVDHEDTNRGNDAWRNLRSATSSTNQANSRKRPSRTSSFKGVYFHKGQRKWIAKIKADRRIQHLGCFDAAEEAHSVYADAARREFGEYARLG